MTVDIYKKTGKLSDVAELENARARAARAEGLVEYVAMMADVELPEEEEQDVPEDTAVV